MSTRINEGLQVDLANYEDVLAFADQAKGLAENLMRQLQAQCVAKAAVSMLDQRSLGLDEEPAIKIPLRYSAKNHVVHQKDDEVWNFNLQIMRGGGKVLIYPLGNLQYYELLLTMPGVSKYGYWSSEFPPDGVTEDEWQRRSDDWDEALAGSHSIRGVGLRLEMHITSSSLGYATDQNPTFWELVLEQQPSLDARRNAVVRDQCLAALTKGLSADEVYGRFVSTLNRVEEVLAEEDLEQVVTGLVPLSQELLQSEEFKAPAATLHQKRLAAIVRKCRAKVRN